MSNNKLHPEVRKYLSEKHSNPDIEPTEKVREYFRTLGKKGGKETKEKHGKKYFSNLSKKRKTHSGGRPTKR